MKKEQLTFSRFCLAFRASVLADRYIIALFVVASLYDTEDYCPTQWGNIDTWLDIMSDEWLDEIWERLEGDEDGKKMDMGERIDVAETDLYIYLFKVINSEAVDLA